MQTVKAVMRGSVPGRPVRVGFYGHGAFVTSAQMQSDILFVAVLGVAADMDVMVFPRWRFPEQLSWAPWHADWPRLSPHGPEVTALGALLGDQGEVRWMRALTQLRQRESGEAPLVQWVWDSLCEHMQRFDPAGAFEKNDPSKG